MKAKEYENMYDSNISGLERSRRYTKQAVKEVQKRKEKENKIKTLIQEENLREDARRFIEKAIVRGYAEYAGDELDTFIPPTSRRHGARDKKKASVLKKIRNIVEIFVST